MATKKEREAALKIEKDILLQPFPSMDELKASSKVLTKVINTLVKKSRKFTQAFHEEAWEAHKTFPYDEKSDLKSAVWGFISVYGYANNILSFEKDLNAVKKAFPSLYSQGKVFLDAAKEDALYIISAQKHIEDEKLRFKGTMAQQFVGLAAKNKEVSFEKQKAFMEYSMSLRTWEPAEIKGDIIHVNGNPYSEGDYVGVMIGAGIRVHKMQIGIVAYKDKITKEAKEGIAIRNRTQWRDSGLVILDLIENIPAELFSEKN